jgi:hypothetical protein
MKQAFVLSDMRLVDVDETIACFARRREEIGMPEVLALLG